MTRAERIHELIAELLRTENPVVVETVSVRVLVVDDNEPWRSFFSTTLLKRPDLRVISEAFDGLEAVQQAQQHQPDIILLDIGLPSLNGIEAARRIREVSPASKILFVSENRSADIAEEALSTRAGSGRLRGEVGSKEGIIACDKRGSGR